MSEKKFDDPVYSKPVAEFITVAFDFILFIEQSESKETKDIYAYMQKVLPLLYIKATLLPAVEITDESANERFVTEENWEGIYNMLKEKIGIEDIYSTQHNIDPYDNDAFNVSMSEDLADIYQDIKDFIMLYQMKSHVGKENAVYWVKYYLGCNWGYKLLRLLKIIHTIVHKDAISSNIDNTSFE